VNDETMKPRPSLSDIPALRDLTKKELKKLWRSLDELAYTPDYEAALHSEFPSEPAEDSSASKISRRDLLRFMAASAALSSLIGCTKLPTEKIIPYVRAPEEIVPGRPLFYATSMPHGNSAFGLLVESHTGRPTKIEGNRLHPASLGSTDIFAQASIRTLWDPDRSQVILHEGRISDSPAFLNAMATLRTSLGKTRGAGLRILTGSTSSPTFARQMQDLLTHYPQAKWYGHEPFAPYAAYEGARLAFGKAVNTVCRLDKADVVVALDSDFLYSGPTSVRYAHDFAQRRNVENARAQMNRLYVIESTPTNTGSMADHRFPLRATEIPDVARAMASALGLGVQSGNSPVPTPWFAAMVRDLNAHKGASLVLAGDAQPPAVHALAHAMNLELGNIGQTVFYTNLVEVSPIADSLSDLVKEIDAGQISTLLIIGSNPVFTAPVDLNFISKLSKVGLRIHLGLYDDETAQYCNWHVPETHFLESWSDARAYDGTVGIVQPLIAPLYRGLSAHELVAILLGDLDTTPHNIVRNYWKGQNASQNESDFEMFWETTLHDGVMAGTAFTPVTANLTLDYPRLPQPTPAAPNSIEIVFRPDPTIGDGRWANNAWLQELPKPLTKLTWDNALMLSPMTAWNLRVTNGDVVDMTVGERKLSGPVWIMPGHADNSATLHLGYGRQRAGTVGTGIGVNGYLLRTSSAPQSSTGLTIKKTGRTYLLANTQLHHPIDQNGHQVEEQSINAFKRDLVRIATLEEFEKNPYFAADHTENDGLSLYAPYKYEGYAWGMSIDLNRCTGCSACVVACYAENNIAVVGKYEVMAGRDMQWIRIDNYYRGDLKNPEMYWEPVPCMHCEQAPCELVCPVGATLHSSEGLNEMIYNRCVGTRYCSNNCPYKVRRFNFKLYSNWESQSLYGMRNPDVTVRSRGVMEKCSYCVQRINEAKIHAEEENRLVRDGEIITACQQACPTNVIVFGNINDPNSQVSKLKASTRNYSLLAELNVRPRTTYLGKLRNPNPEIET